jgi:cytidine deaminase
LNDSTDVRVSVVSTQVLPGKEDDFLALIDELHALIRQRGYGSDKLFQDAGDPRIYYHIRTWFSADAVSRATDDPDVQSLWSRLDESMRFNNLVGMARPVQIWGSTRPGPRGPERRTAPGDRRVFDLRPPGGDRRSGDERRDADRRLGADRRAGADRRSGIDRRIRDLGPPGGIERRMGNRRSGVDRRLPGDRRAAILDESSGDNVARRTLLAAARSARLRAHAPFSSFKVGAAIEAADGSIVTGCNIENATYGLTVCAERVALWKAMSEGHRSFTRIAVVTEATHATPPCGACRQLLWEFGGDLEVLLGDLHSERGRHQLKDLLPLAFDAHNLQTPPTGQAG